MWKVRNDMKVREIPKELYEALEKIEDFCNSYNNCHDCPLYGLDAQVNDECFLWWNTPNHLHDYMDYYDDKYYVREGE